MTLEHIKEAAEAVAKRRYPNDPFRQQAVKEKLISQFLANYKKTVDSF